MSDEPQPADQPQPDEEELRRQARIQSGSLIDNHNPDNPNFKQGQQTWPDSSPQGDVNNPDSLVNQQNQNG
jgi:hypothetical protein